MACIRCKWLVQWRGNGPCICCWSELLQAPLNCSSRSPTIASIASSTTTHTHQHTPSSPNQPGVLPDSDLHSKEVCSSYNNLSNRSVALFGSFLASLQAKERFACRGKENRRVPTVRYQPTITTTTTTTHASKLNSQQRDENSASSLHLVLHKQETATLFRLPLGPTSPSRKSMST